MDNLKLNGKMLKPVANLLESKIQNLMVQVFKQDKIGEITLKLELATIEREGEVDGLERVWTEPIINYQLTERIKETKATNKGGLGQGYKIETDDLFDDICIQEIQ